MVVLPGFGGFCESIDAFAGGHGNGRDFEESLRVKV